MKCHGLKKRDCAINFKEQQLGISSNIAEGSAKPSNVEFAHYLDASVGSAYEVETQLLISKNVGYISEDLYNELLIELQGIEKQLVGLIKVLRFHNKS